MPGDLIGRTDRLDQLMVRQPRVQERLPRLRLQRLKPLPSRWRSLQRLPRQKQPKRLKTRPPKKKRVDIEVYDWKGSSTVDFPVQGAQRCRRY